MLLAKHSAQQHNATRRRLEAPDDLALIERVACGDTSAFDSLFRRYGPRLRRFLERLTRRPQLIDEILNDTMLVIWRRAGTFNLRSKVSTWILGIAMRKGLKAIERSDRAGVVDAEEVPTSTEPDPEEHAIREELRARIASALKSLSPEQRTVVVLTYFEGYSCSEIATIVGCPVDTVKTRMFHARRKLRALLADRREDAA
jgi:RNA polymerase sigma factor (sigma-70 family)